MGHSAFGLTMGYQEPVLELPVVYLFDSPSLRPQAGRPQRRDMSTKYLRNDQEEYMINVTLM